MEAGMSIEVLEYNLGQLDRGIETCLEQRLHTPTLVLVYSAIETVGSLANEDPKAGTRKIFTAWVDQYLLKAKAMNCTATDLYAARCGLVHTATSDADLIDAGKARRVFYVWGTAKVADLQVSIDRAGRGADFVAVHIGELVEGWRLGLAAFLNDLAAAPARQARVYAKGAAFFANYPTSLFRPKFLAEPSADA
jgi:hypothetical protein